MELRIYTILFVSAHLAAMALHTAYAVIEWETQKQHRNQKAPDKHPAHTSVCTSGSTGVPSTSEPLCACAPSRKNSDASSRFASVSWSNMSTESASDAVSLRSTTTTRRRSFRTSVSSSSQGSTRSSSGSSSGVYSEDSSDPVSPCSSTSSSICGSSVLTSASSSSRPSSNPLSPSGDEDPFYNTLPASSPAGFCDCACEPTSTAPKSLAGRVFQGGSLNSFMSQPCRFLKKNERQRGNYDDAVSPETTSSLTPSPTGMSFHGSQPSRSRSVAATRQAVSLGEVAVDRSLYPPDTTTVANRPSEETRQSSICMKEHKKAPCSREICSRASCSGGFTASPVREQSERISGAEDSKVSAAKQENPACTIGFTDSASSPMRCQRGKNVHFPHADGGVCPPPSGRLQSAGLSLRNADEEASTVGNDRIMPHSSLTLPCEKSTINSTTPPERKAPRNVKPLHLHSLNTADRVQRAEDHGKQSAQDLSGATGAENHQVPAYKLPDESLKKSRDISGSAKPEKTTALLQTRQGKTTNCMQLNRKGDPTRFSPYKTPELNRHSSLPKCHFAPTIASSSGERVKRAHSLRSPGLLRSFSVSKRPSGRTTAAPSAAPASDMSRWQPMTLPAREATGHEPGSEGKPSSIFHALSKKAAVSVRSRRSKNPSLAAGASEALSFDSATAAQTAQQQLVEELSAREDTQWHRLGHYAYGCADSSLQQSLERLTREVRDLVSIMRNDTHRSGPCFQDPSICQEQRPHMVCPDVLRYIGSKDLVDLAKNAPRNLEPAGEQEACLLESVLPTGTEIRFTSLVRGKPLTLKREALFALARPVHLMIMRDEEGRKWFLEIAIVDCNSFTEELSIHREIYRLRALKHFRLQSSLKIDAIADAMGLNSVRDVLMLDPEKITSEDGSNCLYTVTPFVSVKEPWLTDLGTLVELLKKEALGSQNPERIYNMQLNLTVQILAVVGSLDSHGALPKHFSMQDFALRSQGTILGLFTPVVQSSSTGNDLSMKQKALNQTRYSLVSMVAAIWCTRVLDYEILGKASDWRIDESLYFHGCDPTMPAEVKKLIVELCSPKTVNLYAFLHERDFRDLAQTVRDTGLRKEKQRAADLSGMQQMQQSKWKVGVQDK